MKIVSSLLNLTGTPDSMHREEDQLVIESSLGTHGSLKSTIYLGTEDVRAMISLLLNWSVISFIFLLPFYLIREYLMGKDLSQRLSTFSLITSLFLSAALVFIGYRYLSTYPFLASFILFFFSFISALSAILSQRKSLLYLSVFLFSIAYFCLVYFLGWGQKFYPLFSLIPISLLAYLGYILREKGLFYPSLHTSSMLLTFWFLGYIIIFLSSYFEEGLWIAAISLFGFSSFYFFRYYLTRSVRYQYAMLIFFSLGFLLTLYTLRGLEASYYGIPLIGLGFIMLQVGNKYLDTLGISQVSPFYLMGIFLSLFAFFYSVQERAPLLLSPLFLSASLFTTNSYLEPKAKEKTEIGFSRSFVTLAQIPSYIYLLLLLWYDFPKDLLTILTALGFSLLYLKVSYERKETIFKVRSQYIYLFGIFFLLFYFLSLATYNPLGGTKENMFMTIPLLLGILYYSHLESKRGRKVFSDSLVEVSYLLLVLAFLLPILLEDHSLFLSFSLLFIFLLCYLFFINLNPLSLYSLPIIFSALYYNLLVLLKVPFPLFGILFLPPGLGSMVLALASHQKIFYFSWFFLSAISLSLSLYTLKSYYLLNLFNFTLWATAYLMASELITRKREVIVPVVEA